MIRSLHQCLLFDQDGTLVDSLPGIEFAIHRAFQAVGMPSPNVELKQFLGPPIRSIFSALAATGDSALLDRMEAAFRSSYDSEGWQMTRCFTGARETLEALDAEGHRLFMVTNKPRRVTLRILERERLLPLFERIYTRDSRTPPYVSKAEMLRNLLRDCVVSPSQCLMIGDSMEDVNASGAVNIPFALMEHGYGQITHAAPVAMRLFNFSQFLTYSTRGCSR